MINVYFETNGYAELIATFKDEQVYIACLPALKKQCIKLGFEIVTESINE